jgi:DnaJ-class molecular chaperone
MTEAKELTHLPIKCSICNGERWRIVWESEKCPHCVDGYKQNGFICLKCDGENKILDKKYIMCDACNGIGYFKIPFSDIAKIPLTLACT